MNYAKIFLSAALAVFLSSVSFAVKPGQPAPDFSLTDIHGKDYKLSDYAGKIVVLEWTNYGCPYVKNHYNSGNMQRQQAAMADKEVVLAFDLLVQARLPGPMSSADWVKTVESKGVKSAAVLIDEKSKVARAYGAVTTPHMFVIDPSGVVAYNEAIDSNSSDIERAEKYVILAVEAVQAGKPVERSTSKPYGCGIKYASES